MWIMEIDDMTGKSVHTPGPWMHSKFDDSSDYVHEQRSTSGDIAEVKGHFRSEEERQANINLIIAAPDLLSTLKECADRMSNMALNLESDAILLDRAIAAIAKAEGRMIDS
jgi:hypothetical protein